MSLRPCRFRDTSITGGTVFRLAIYVCPQSWLQRRCCGSGSTHSKGSNSIENKLVAQIDESYLETLTSANLVPKKPVRHRREPSHPTTDGFKVK